MPQMQETESEGEGSVLTHMTKPEARISKVTPQMGYYAKVSTELLPAHRHTTIRKPNGAKHLGEVRLSLLYNSNASPLTGRTIGYFFLK